MPIILLCIKKYVLRYAKILAIAYSYGECINYKLWPKFWRILKQMDIERTE